MITLYKAINIFFNLMEVLILIRIIFSFLNIGPYNSIGKIVYELTEPILGPTRELIYRLGINTGMLDFSPIVAVLILRLISKVLLGILIR